MVDEGFRGDGAECDGDVNIGGHAHGTVQDCGLGPEDVPTDP